MRGDGPLVWDADGEEYVDTQDRDDEEPHECEVHGHFLVFMTLVCVRSGLADGGQ